MTTAGTFPDQGDERYPWVVAGLVGALFTVVGGLELGQLIFPLNLGNTNWEFGTYASVMDSLPLLLLGLAFLAAAAVTARRPVLARITGTLFFLLVVVLLLGAFLFLTSLPQILGPRQQPAVLTGLKKAVVKASVQSVVFPIGMIWLGVNAWRYSRSRR